MLSTRIVPPFTAESVAAKVQMAADAWNSKDPERVNPLSAFKMTRGIHLRRFRIRSTSSVPPFDGARDDEHE